MTEQTVDIVCELNKEQDIQQITKGLTVASVPLQIQGGQSIILAEMTR